MNPDKKRLLFAAVLAGLAFALALGWFNLEERRLLQRGETIKILAAKRYLPAYARLEAKDLAWLSLPRAYAPIGAVSDASAVLGLQTLVPFNAEEPLIFNKLALGEQSLASAVPEGKRAVSLPVNAVSGVSGLLRPGDHVDVLLLHGKGAQASAALLLQDIPVLAVGSRLTREDAPAASGGTVTLALGPADAALAVVALSGGELHLALRAAGDSRPAPITKAGFGDALRRTERSAAPAPEYSPAEGTVDDLIPRKR